MRAQVSKVGMVKNIEVDCARSARHSPVNAARGRCLRPDRAKCRRRRPGRRRPHWPHRARRRSAAAARARFFGPTPAMSSSRLPPVRTLARRARMPVMAKRCASSRICATSISAAESWPSVDLVAAVGKDQFFQADLAALALLHADDQRQVQAQLLEHLARHRHLALAAVDQHQVGQPRARRWLARPLLVGAASPRPAWRSAASAPGAWRHSRRRR